MMKKAICTLERAYHAVLVVMTALIVLVGIYQVIGRFFVFLHLPTSWTEESMRYTYIGIIMLGLATVTRAEAFTTITVLSDAIEKRSRIGGQPSFRCHSHAIQYHLRAHSNRLLFGHCHQRS